MDETKLESLLPASDNALDNDVKQFLSYHQTSWSEIKPALEKTIKEFIIPFFGRGSIEIKALGEPDWNLDWFGKEKEFTDEELEEEYGDCDPGIANGMIIINYRYNTGISYDKKCKAEDEAHRYLIDHFPEELLGGIRVSCVETKFR